MKIIIQSEGNTKEAKVDSRFGRCAYFMIYDTESKEYNANENTFTNGGSAGVKAGTFVIENGDALIGVNIGPNAFQTLNAGNIKIFSGIPDLSIEENINKYLKNELEELGRANAEGHNNL